MASKTLPEFKIQWSVKNVMQYLVMQFVSRDVKEMFQPLDLAPSPLTPPNPFNERNGYTAVIELPHSITDVVGDGALVMDFDIGCTRTKGRVDLSFGRRKLEYNSMIKNWSAAEELCVS